MAYDRLAALKHMKKENERKEVLCQEIEEFWKEDCYGDVEDFFACSPMEYKLVASSLRRLEVEAVETLSGNVAAMSTALKLAMTVVPKKTMIDVTSPIAHAQHNLDKEIKKLEDNKSYG